jgi:hypothetical protein
MSELWLSKSLAYGTKSLPLRALCNADFAFIWDDFSGYKKTFLQQWFNAIWHITNQKYGANALGLQRILGFGSYWTS